MIEVFDGVLTEPEAYRALAVGSTFSSLTFGPDTFHGIAPAPDSSFPSWFQANFPEFDPTLTFLRASPQGQQEPNFIHNDVEMGDVTAILYLNPIPAPGDGTAFWERNGQRKGRALAGAEGQDEIPWACWRKVDAAFNRAVVFAAPLFHSRALRENYGVGEDARLIQVLFAKLRS